MKVFATVNPSGQFQPLVMSKVNCLNRINSWNPTRRGPQCTTWITNYIDFNFIFSPFFSSLVLFILLRSPLFILCQGPPPRRCVSFLLSDVLLSPQIEATPTASPPEQHRRTRYAPLSWALNPCCSHSKNKQTQTACTNNNTDKKSLRFAYF